MTETDSPPLPEARQQRQYFKVQSDFSYVTSKAEYIWQNREELGRYKLGPRKFKLGFPPHWEENLPQILLKKHGKRKPLDIFRFDRAWLISSPLKRLLENFDPEAFDFLPTKTTYGKGLEEGEIYWLCDVIRVLDCVDESQSQILYQTDISWKHYTTLIKAIMIPEVIQEAHLFRLLYQSAAVCGDDDFYRLIHANGITGFWFTHLDGTLKEGR